MKLSLLDWQGPLGSRSCLSCIWWHSNICSARICVLLVWPGSMLQGKQWLTWACLRNYARSTTAFLSEATFYKHTLHMQLGKLLWASTGTHTISEIQEGRSSLNPAALKMAFYLLDRCSFQHTQQQVCTDISILEAGTVASSMYIVGMDNLVDIYVE